MIGLGAKYLTAAGFGRYRISAASLGRGWVMCPWLLSGTARQDIMAAFGVDGAAVIAATNEYLNGIAQSQGQQAAQQMADYINTYPLAGVLNQDGLVFQMDCGYECSASAWKDLKGNKIFEGSGMSLTDGVPTFDGSGRYTLNEILNFGTYSNCTIEVVFEVFNLPSSDRRRMALFAIDRVPSPSMLLVYTSSGNSSLWSAVNSRNYPMAVYYLDRDTILQANTLTTISSNNSRAFLNKDALTYYISNWQTGMNYTNNTYIGYWYNGSDWNSFQGKIYAIRIYNRLLTEAEILANQEIDLKRWTPPTP